MKYYHLAACLAASAFIGSSLGGMLTPRQFSPSAMVTRAVVEPNSANPVPAMLQSETVLIKNVSGNYGTGIVTIRQGRAFIWTAAHVVGTDPEVRVFRGGLLETTGRVLEVDEKTDLALLEVPFFSPVCGTGVEFVDSDDRPVLGTQVCHVGNYGGTSYPGSYSVGVVSAVSRVIQGRGPLDQVSCLVRPGSSGGGIFLMDGRCIGIVVRQAVGESQINFMVPVRVIRVWAKTHHVGFAL